MSNKKLLKQISGTVTGSINSQLDWDFINYSGQALAAASAGYRTYGIVMAPYATRNEVTSMLNKLGDIFADTKSPDEMVPRGYVTGHVCMSSGEKASKVQMRLTFLPAVHARQGDACVFPCDKAN